MCILQPCTQIDVDNEHTECKCMHANTKHIYTTGSSWKNMEQTVLCGCQDMSSAKLGTFGIYYSAIECVQVQCAHLICLHLVRVLLTLLLLIHKTDNMNVWLCLSILPLSEPPNQLQTVQHYDRSICYADALDIWAAMATSQNSKRTKL